MSAFNTVRLTQACPTGNHIGEFEVQFKYGDCWQYEYRLGDKLKWGGNDNGKPGHKRVVVDGVGYCSKCGPEAEYPDYEVWLEHDQIVSVRPACGQYDFVNSPDTYIVVEE